jgi:hypothetical protein
MMKIIRHPYNDSPKKKGRRGRGRAMTAVEIAAVTGGELSSCTCYDNDGQVGRVYEGGVKMFKQIRCRQECCGADVSGSYQWGVNIDPLASIRACKTKEGWEL